MSGRSADRQWKRIMTMVAAVIVAGFACSVLTVAAYDRFFAQKVVAVDLTGYVAGQKNRYVAGEITARELIDSIEGVLRYIGERPKKEVLVLDEAISGNVKRLELEPLQAVPGPGERDTSTMPE